MRLTAPLRTRPKRVLIFHPPFSISPPGTRPAKPTPRDTLLQHLTTTLLRHHHHPIITSSTSQALDLIASPHTKRHANALIYAFPKMPKSLAVKIAPWILEHGGRFLWLGPSQQGEEFEGGALWSRVKVPWKVRRMKGGGEWRFSGVGVGRGWRRRIDIGEEIVYAVRGAERKERVYTMGEGVAGAVWRRIGFGGVGYCGVFAEEQEATEDIVMRMLGLVRGETVGEEKVEGVNVEKEGEKEGGVSLSSTKHVAGNECEVQETSEVEAGNPQGGEVNTSEAKASDTITSDQEGSVTSETVEDTVTPDSEETMEEKPTKAVIGEETTPPHPSVVVVPQNSSALEEEYQEPRNG